MKSQSFLVSMISVAAHATANTEFSVEHGLMADETRAMTPATFTVVDQLQAGSLYDSGTAWTNSLAYLKSDVANGRFTVIFF